MRYGPSIALAALASLAAMSVVPATAGVLSVSISGASTDGGRYGTAPSSNTTTGSESVSDSGSGASSGGGYSTTSTMSSAATATYGRLGVRASVTGQATEPPGGLTDGHVSGAWVRANAQASFRDTITVTSTVLFSNDPVSFTAHLRLVGAISDNQDTGCSDEEPSFHTLGNANFFVGGDRLMLITRLNDCNRVLRDSRTINTFVGTELSLEGSMDAFAQVSSNSEGAPDAFANVNLGNTGYFYFTLDGAPITLVSQFGEGSDYSAPLLVGVAAPEPATLALVGLGLAGLGLARRRKAKTRG